MTVLEVHLVLIRLGGQTSQTQHIVADECDIYSVICANVFVITLCFLLRPHGNI